MEKVKVGDLFLGTRIPSHGKVSTSVFIVKGFHQQLKLTTLQRTFHFEVC